MNKFEKLVELIINENEEKAQALFHEIVVEKSREIYNQLVNEDDDSTDDFVSDIEADEEGGDLDMDDAADDLEGDLGVDGDDDDYDVEDEEVEDRLVDLETALDDLRAEFEAITGGGDDDMGDDDMDMDMGDEMDMGDDADMDMGDEDEFKVENFVREYTEKVGSVGNTEGAEVAKGGSVAVNKTSIVAKKNDMGGTTANIAKGGTATEKPAQKAQMINTGNRNVPGGKAGNMEKAPAAKKGE